MQFSCIFEKKYSAMVTRFRGIPKKLDMAGLVLEVVY
jgi:hypothetical protein